VRPEGFKHAFVTALAAGFLFPGRLEISGAPTQTEAQTLVQLLRAVGVEGQLVGSCASIEVESVAGDFPVELFDSIHGSLYLIPGLLVHTGKARLRAAGGCAIGDVASGARPTIQYANVLERFGAIVDYATGDVRLPARGFKGAKVDLRDFTDDRQALSGPLYSGATKFAILCAAAATGRSEVLYPYPKADVTELITVLRKVGVSILSDHEDDERLIITGGVAQAAGDTVRHVLVPDLMQTLTWLVAGQVTSGEVGVIVEEPDRLVAALRPELDALEAMGLRVRNHAGILRLVQTADAIQPIDLRVQSRGVFSDAQPMFALLMAGASGKSTISDQVWRGRYGYAKGLATLGADVTQEGARLVIQGASRPWKRGASVVATDLRAGVCLTLAAAAADGSSVVRGVDHIDRGFTGFEERLASLGASVRRRW